MAEYIEKSEIYRRYFNNRCGVVRLHVSDIDVIPAADVAPVVHGRWSWDTGDMWTCSVCGTRNHIKEVMGRPDFNYCPDCGALMNKEAPNGD